MTTGQPVYPFSAIVGQDEMKLGLILCAIDPRIGGVLIMGHRGTGKSTAVRALAGLLPYINRSLNCPYGCDPKSTGGLCPTCSATLRNGLRPRTERSAIPVVELPLGATEDRICGSLDLEQALNAGAKVFQPGLLARAHRGFLYIDEINLLEDHLVDLLLDAASSGQHVVEREGFSFRHPASFVLVGSGNPEEGELRPQLLDRFGLYVRVETMDDLASRVEVIRNREQFDRDGIAFLAAMEPAQLKLRRRLVRARRVVPQVDISSELLLQVARLCLQLKLLGHRGELSIIRAAKALAAFEGRKEVRTEDVRRVAVMALSHRLRRDLHGEMDPGVRIRQALDDSLAEAPAGSSRKPSSCEQEDLILPAVDAVLPRGICEVPAIEQNQRGRHRNSRVVTAVERAGRLAFDASLRAAAPLQQVRRDDSRPGSAIRVRFHADDLRFRREMPDSRRLIIFVIDTSGSMALNRIREAKGAVQRLLREAYPKRHKVAVVAFRGERARIVLPPSRSSERARTAMDELAVGGATPLGAGISAALDLALRARTVEGRQSLLVLLTDGCANATASAAQGESVWHELERICCSVRKHAVPAIVIDTRAPFLSRGEGQRVACMLGARYVALPRLETGSLSRTVAESIGAP